MKRQIVDSRLQNKQWLARSVNHILEPILLQIYIDKPTDNVQFMLDFIEAKYGVEALNGKPGELAKLQKKCAALEKLLCQEKKESYDSQESDQSSDSEDEQQRVGRTREQRFEVSSEAFGSWNQRKQFIPRVIDKDEEQVNEIRKCLEGCFLFECLGNFEKIIVIYAMEEINSERNQKIIVQGEPGDCLYLITSGTLRCTKVFPGSTSQTFLKTYQPGEIFGELSLLYNTPRAATITANDECVLYKLDRETFNQIVKGAAYKKRQKYEGFLQKVSIFKTIEPYERLLLADAIQEHTYKANELIIEQGCDSQNLMFLVSGVAIATKLNFKSQEEEQVMRYVAGDYFGERALVCNETRAASVRAVTDCEVLSLSAERVKPLLGSLSDLLKRNMELYEQFM